MEGRFGGLHRSGCGQICGFPVSNWGMACGQVGDGCAQPVHGLGKTPAQPWGWRNCGQIGLAAGFLPGGEGKATAPAQKSSRDPHPDPPVRGAPAVGAGRAGAAERRNPCAGRPVVRTALGIRVLHRVCTAAGGLRERAGAGFEGGSFCERWVPGADRCGRKVRREARGGPAGRGSRRQRRCGRVAVLRSAPVGSGAAAVLLRCGRRSPLLRAGTDSASAPAHRPAEISRDLSDAGSGSCPGGGAERFRAFGREIGVRPPRMREAIATIGGGAGWVGRTPTSGGASGFAADRASRLSGSGAIGSGGSRVRSRPGPAASTLTPCRRRSAGPPVLFRLVALHARARPQAAAAHAGRNHPARPHPPVPAATRRATSAAPDERRQPSDYRSLANTTGAYASPAGRSESESISAAR